MEIYSFDLTAGVEEVLILESLQRRMKEKKKGGRFEER